MDWYCMIWIHQHTSSMGEVIMQLMVLGSWAALRGPYTTAQAGLVDGAKQTDSLMGQWIFALSLGMECEV